MLEEHEFARLEVDAFAREEEFAGGEIHGEIVECEGALLGGAADAAYDGLGAGEEFAEGEGFWDEVIGTAFEAADAFLDGAFGAEDDDGDGVSFGAETFDEGEAVGPREHEVDYGEVEACGGGELPCGLCGGDGIDGEAALSKALVEERGDLGVIFDDEDAHGVGFGDEASGKRFAPYPKGGGAPTGKWTAAADCGVEF